MATALRDETMTFPAGLSGFWSAFCLSGQAEGVTLRNLKFELTGHTLSADFPLGVSNEFTGEAAEVSRRPGDPSGHVAGAGGLLPPAAPAVGPD